MNKIRLLAVVAGLAGSTVAGATQWGHNGSSGNFSAVALTSGSIYCSTTTCQAGSSGGLTGSVIKLTAYSTPGPEAGTTVSPNDTGSWQAAQIAIYQNSTGFQERGIGISNTQETGGTSETDPAQVERMIDNNGVNDILVIDFGSSGWDVSSFFVGTTCNASNDVCPANVNIAAWVGDTFNSTTIATGFSTNGSAAQLSGFTPLAFTPDPGGVGSRAETTTAKGQYLVIAGDLGSYQDAFTIKGITADRVTTPTGQTPVPGSAPLAGLALLALAWAHRRRQAVARAR